MAQIIISAHDPIPTGAIVTGYAISKEYPRPHTIRSVAPTELSRVYKGFGAVRAETGVAPRRGFGTLIGGATARFGETLWLRVED